MKEIRGDAKSIRALLSGAKFSVDYYQREYRWETKQIAELLEDLSENRQQAITQTASIGEKILTALNQTYHLGEHEYHGTPSIGATLFRGQQETEEELIKQADQAMYQVKAAGRNALRFFDPAMRASGTNSPAAD